jgi:DNA-binding NtrC family response regulator
MLVASPQSSLRQLAGQGQLLPDLAFRLTAVRFAIPPLRMRREDIAPIAQALLDRICTRYQHRPVALSSSALGRLLLHAWPGNVREMASVLEAALLEAVNDVIRPEDLPLQSEMDAAPTFQAALRPASLTLDDVIHRHVAICSRPESWQQAAHGPAAPYQPLDPLSHPWQSEHPHPLKYH